jgi:hypothetical protein
MSMSSRSIEYVLDALCNYYFIYGEDRSKFMSGWVSEIRIATSFDSYYFDKPAPEQVFRGFNYKPINGRHFFIREALKDMCEDIREWGDSPIHDEKYLTNQCCKYFEAAWKYKERENFKRKLAGQRVIRDW